MLKISEAEKADTSVTLRLEGRVVGPWVGELGQVCEALLMEGRLLKLDMTEVWFVDPDGVLALFGLKSRGAVIIKCSPFVEEQLKSCKPR